MIIHFSLNLKAVPFFHYKDGIAHLTSKPSRRNVNLFIKSSPRNLEGQQVTVVKFFEKLLRRKRRHLSTLTRYAT